MGNQSHFVWERQPAAEALLKELLHQCCAENRNIAQLSHELECFTSTRLFDWIDHIIVGSSEEVTGALIEAGFVVQGETSRYLVFAHPGAQLGRVLMRKDHQSGTLGLVAKVESCADFLMVRGLSGDIEGALFGGYRRCLVAVENGVSLWVAERRGTLTMEPTQESEDHVGKYLHSCELWQTRPRTIKDEAEALRIAQERAEQMVAVHGKDLAAWIVLEMERKYWEARNTAGQLQRRRQERVGMGWANHDHHTFRSSRSHFSQLVKLFETLGFHCRERFYAGQEAGWGAQVMEQSKAGLVLFLDLDLEGDEPHVDFAHQSLPVLGKLGTVGLWCALHGDSILKAGMHHLEAQFDHERLTQDLAEHGVGMMDPFSNFPYLKQAFTQGEVWQVDPARVSQLMEQGLISKEEGDKFLQYGAIGSHLENLERNEGYKGFNQKNVSYIIQKTDPRKQVGTHK